MAVILNDKVPSDFYLRNTMLYVDIRMLKINYPHEVGGSPCEVNYEITDIWRLLYEPFKREIKNLPAEF